MTSLRDNNFKSIYILREAPSEEPLAVFRDLRDAYRYSTSRCMEIRRTAYTTVKEYYLLEEELATAVRATIWYDNTSELKHTVAKYQIMD
jgi:hypothetical protein